jgi:hypothetical protein
MKPFPNIWTDGTIACFWLQGYLVQVPIKLGSNDNRAHVIRWLHHAWPFRVKVGKRGPRLVKADAKTEIQLHKVYSELVHGDAFVVEATDGNLLRWTPENIGPRRKPEKLATPAQQDSEVANQMWLRERDGSLEYIAQSLARGIKADQAQFSGAKEDLATSEQKTALENRAVALLTEWERRLAATKTRGDVDAERTEDHLEVEMPQDESVPDPRPESYPDCVVHLVPHHKNNTDDNAKAPRADEEDWMPTVHRWPESYDLTLAEFRDLLGSRTLNNPNSEFVLNSHGWYSPENGSLPIYVGCPKDIEQMSKDLQPQMPENGTSAVEGRDEPGKLATTCAPRKGLQSVITRD